MERQIDIFSIKQVQLPNTALLLTYASMENCYTDCFAVDAKKLIPLEDYTLAFLTSPIFKIERWILRIALKKPSTDEQAALLAQNKISSFAAWNVEGRKDTQLLMRDFSDKTRFWIMVKLNPELETTTLYFGSAVLPNNDGHMSKSIAFKVLMQFHKLYSKVLLWSAKSNLK